MPPARPLMRTSTVDVSARRTYNLLDEPVGDEYRALLAGALSHCDTIVLLARDKNLSAGAEAVMQQLEHFRKGAAQSGAMGWVHRFQLNKGSLEVLTAAAHGLYDWRPPTLLEDLCLFRTDGSPWLVSIAAERLGYVELTPFEKLLLGRAAPGLAAVLAHQAAKDAILAYFERTLEGHREMLAADLRSYATTMAADGREGLIAALAEWLTSGEPTRVVVALDLIKGLRLRELHGDVEAIHRALVANELTIPVVYKSNAVLRDRWRARYQEQLAVVLRSLSERPEPSAG